MNPLTGEIVPVTFVGQMVPGTGYTCGVITPDTPVPDQRHRHERDGSYVEGGEGFIESPGIQFDPRFGMALALNPKTVIRAGAGAFHDGTGGPDFRGGPAFEFDRVVRYTDMDSYLTGTGSVSPDQRQRHRARGQAAGVVPLPGRLRARAGLEHRRQPGLRRRHDAQPSAELELQPDSGGRAVPARESRRHRTGFGDGRPPAEQAEPRRAAGRVPAPDPRLRRHQHQQADRQGTLRFAPAAGEPAVHRRLRAGGELHLREGLRKPSCARTTRCRRGVSAP